MGGGERLRQIRERLGLTIREVEAASGKLAEKYRNSDYAISLSRLSDIETKDVTPNIYKFYSFAVIYRRDLIELLGYYGLEMGCIARDSEAFSIPRTHIMTATLPDRAEVPVRLDPGFDLRTTMAVGRMIVEWGVVPMATINRFKCRDYTYGYIGAEDRTMYPLLLPGTFVQIDETLRRIEEGPWRSEFERPIYFLETRDEFLCSWCELNGPVLAVTPHPMSQVRTRLFRFGSEVDVLGRVVGIAMRLNGWSPLAHDPGERDFGK